MKCEIPGCDNEVANKIAQKTIYFGLVEECKLSICDCHDKNEVQKHLQAIGEEQSNLSQIVNPFLVCKSLHKSCV